MFQDYKDLLSAFHAHGVKYLIVGGYAVILPLLATFPSQLGKERARDLRRVNAVA